ncbi:MAG: hypothetical protein GY719_04990 [bacterium]|nr:hypothetical protein [bacterium]
MKKVLYLTMPLVFILVALSAVFKATAVGSLTVYDTSCSTLCDAKDPRCLLVNYRNADEVGELEDLREKFQEPAPLKVAPEDIADIFSMHEYLDTMRTRGNISVDTRGKVTHSGQPRSVIFEFRDGIFTQTADVHFPAEIEGRMWTAGEDVHFKFSDPDKAFKMTFSNGTVDNRFGGPVQEIEVTKDSGMIGTPNGCVQVPFKEHLLDDITARNAGTAALLGLEAAFDVMSPLTRDFGSDYFCNPPGPHCEEYPDP